MQITRRIIVALSLTLLTSCAPTLLSPADVAESDGAVLLSKIYLISSKTTPSDIDQKNQKLIIDELERRQLVDIVTLTKIRRRSSGDLWPNEFANASDIVAMRGPPEFKSKHGEYELWEYLIEFKLGDKRLIDDRVLCVAQNGKVIGSSVLVEAPNYLLKSSSTYMACGGGRYVQYWGPGYFEVGAGIFHVKMTGH